VTPRNLIVQMTLRTAPASNHRCEPSVSTELSASWVRTPLLTAGRVSPARCRVDVDPSIVWSGRWRPAVRPQLFWPSATSRACRLSNVGQQ
jgi:hypothetical protein